MPTYVTVAVLAYLLGSIPFGLLLARVFLGTDVRKIGSGNIGATNVMRTGSKKLGIATLVLDAAKGYLAVALAFVLTRGVAAGPDGRQRWIAVGIAVLGALLGHIFPVWLKFRGGKGVATGVGVFIGLAPKAVLIVLGIFVLIFVSFRYVSLASIIATAAFPAVAYRMLHGDQQPLMPFMICGALLIIVKHHQNINRLLRGSESRFEFSKR
jgi:glycerol-3-phosphate acyltransferase PlsY